MAEQWKRIEHPESVPVHLEVEDECYFAREYVSRGGFQAGTGNNLIANFKKTPERRGKPEWRWKVNAVQQFARELNELITTGTIAAIPTSKRRDDPLYDSRFDETLAALKRLNPAITLEAPFEVHTSHQSAHMGGERGVDAFYDTLRWTGFSKPPDDIILLDDVVTTGAHFKACQRLIWEHHPGLKVYGVFWAKVTWPSVDEIAPI